MFIPSPTESRRSGRKRNMIDHFIFDFDGTISDSYPIFLTIFKEIAEARGYTISLSDTELDRTMRITLRYAFETLGWENFCTWKDFLDEFHRRQKAYTKDYRAFPEAEALLRQIAEKGKKSYIYTHSGKVMHDMLKNMGLYDFFDFILDASFGFPEKPKPDALLFFIQKFGLDPKTCMMIGDRPIDAQAGMNAGMLGCLWDKDDLFPDFCPDIRVVSLLDIKILK